jgi:hypothetical protein
VPRLVPAIEPEHVIPFALWPITAHSGWLPLHGSMTSEEVGTAMYRLVCWNSNSDDPELPHSIAAAVDELVDGLVDQGRHYVPGGLLLHDPVSGVTAEPGCCCDLDEWRDWVAALSGHPVSLGHGLAPLLEHRGDTVRVWARVDDEAEVLSGPCVDFELAALPDMLRSAQRDLIAFLDLTRAWAEDVAPDRAARLCAALDVELSITEPLPILDERR